MYSKWKLLIMQETEIYEWMESFLHGRPGLEIFEGTGVCLWDLYHAEQEANSVGRNLVGELILKICIIHKTRWTLFESAEAGRTRSTTLTEFTVHRQLAVRAFSYARVSAWNAVPEDLLAGADPEDITKLLKTHYDLRSRNFTCILCYY